MKRVRKLFSAEEALALFQNIVEGESDGGEFRISRQTGARRTRTPTMSRIRVQLLPHGRDPRRLGAPPQKQAFNERQDADRLRTRVRHSVKTHLLHTQPPRKAQRSEGRTALSGNHATPAVTDKESALLCLLDARMLEHIRDCTVAQARLAGAHAWELSIGQLKAFIALLYVRGAFSKNIEMESLWLGEWGLPFFQSTMPRSRQVCPGYGCVAVVCSKHIRCYRPSDNLTVDEQLFPTKARCRFTQYMANKPDKFGIKFWVVAEVTTKYFLNGFPYLGKNEARPPGQRLGESIVLKLVEPFMDKGRNVTVDNFFTSLSLANSLLRRNTSLVGTMNAARRELPPSAHQRAELFSSKCGVDTLDQMARKYTVKGATRRWPLAVFYNILDLAAINAWVLFQQCTGTNISPRAFILELAKELRRDVLRAKASSNAPELQLLPHPQVPGNRRQCQINRSLSVEVRREDGEPLSCMRALNNHA
ncbi:hypothetical protein WMY93_022631 [Mugilogobius chulae]|uniref:PiggyBac transposable element-derived protein domain-containing protein n=1 Tax=Mugilogobius chulae TaxID=88201 RepID=A0AAW0NJT5_9GOBI